MKFEPSFHIAFLICTTAICGCYLDHSAVGGEQDLAPALGVAASEFVMLRDAYFKQDPVENEFGATLGALALTNKDLYLIEGNIKTGETGEELRIPLAEMEGVHFTDQIQLNLGGGRIVLWLISKDHRLYDDSSMKRLYEWLTSHGVPIWESDAYYAIHDYSKRKRKLPGPNWYMLRGGRVWK